MLYWHKIDTILGDERTDCGCPKVGVVEACLVPGGMLVRHVRNRDKNITSSCFVPESRLKICREWISERAAEERARK